MEKTDEIRELKVLQSSISLTNEDIFNKMFQTRDLPPPKREKLIAELLSCMESNNNTIKGIQDRIDELTPPENG